MLFTSRNELSIDAQQRLAIPAKVRGLLEDAGDAAALYAVHGPNGALWLWPTRTFETVSGQLEPSLAPVAAMMDFDELTFPDTHRLDIDNAGRIRLPQELLEAAGLGSRVLLAGVRHHLEIWDPERWAERRREMEARRAEIIQRARPYMPEGWPGPDS